MANRQRQQVLGDRNWLIALVVRAPVVAHPRGANQPGRPRGSARLRGWHGMWVRSRSLLLLIAVLADLTQSASVAGQEVVEVVSIGGHGVGVGQWFHRIRDVRSSADGRIYVADSELCKVFIYSAKGSYIGAAGGKGFGPAELQDIAAIRVDSVLTVWDAQLHRSVRFSLDGAHLGTRAQPRDSRLGFGTTRELSHGYVLSELYPVMTIQEQVFSPFYRLVVSRPGMSPDTVARFRSNNALWFDASDGVPYSSAWTPFGDAGAWTTIGDSTLVFADGYTGEVTWLHMRPTGVGAGRSALVPVGVRAVSGSDLSEIKRQIRAEFDDAVPRRIELRGPSLWSGITRLVADESSGLIYIGTPVTRGSLQWRVLHPDDAVTPFVLPERLDLKSVRGDMLYGVVKDEFGISTVRVLRSPR